MNLLVKELIQPLLNFNLNELENYETRYWALHADIFDALKKDPDKVYNLLKDKLQRLKLPGAGERLKALEYFYNEYFLRPEKLMENCGCMHTQQPINFRSALASLTKYMIDQGYNITPLPKVKIINNDIENADNILGKTAYYDPSSCSITLYTLNRHPKDVLRSYSHEMIHRIQDNEERLNNVNTTNTNEDSNLQELEKEAYLNGNMIFRNWEDSLKNPKPVNEVYFLDTEKYNRPKTFIDKLRESLHEITLSKDNAIEIYGNLDKGKFQVGNTTYTYDIKQVSNPYDDGGRFFNIMFHPEENVTSTPQEGKENYIKILSTMYKVILNFAEEAEPEYIGIASMDNNNSKNYHTIYTNLTDNKFNRIPGYFRKDVSLEFNTPQGKGKFIVLKRILK